MKRIHILFFLLLTLASCRVSREQARPDVKLPAQYRSEQPADSVLATLPGVQDFFTNGALQTLIDTALVYNNDLRIAVKNVETAQTVLKQVRLNYLPDLNAQIQASRNRTARNSLAGVGNEAFLGTLTLNDFNASLGLNWEINLWGRVQKQKEQALATLLQSQEIRRGIQTRLVADVASGYYNLLMLDEQLHIAQDSRRLADSTVMITNAQFNVGEATLLAIQQAKAQLEATQQLIPQIEQSLTQQENALSLLCGQYARSIARQAQPGEAFTVNPKGGYAVSLLAARPDIHAAEYALRAANAQVGLAQIAMYPRLTITAQSGLTSFQVANWVSVPGSFFWNIAGGLVQPVFQRLQLKTQYEQAMLERDRVALTFQQAVLVGYTEVSNALVANQKIDEQMQAALRRRQALEEGIGSTQLLFRNGMANYLEIISAQSNYLQSRLAVTQLQREKAVATIDLYRALGGGWR
jgi:NodT family efflux transporter outer membrane factor (OMF) lipoprotein